MIIEYFKEEARKLGIDLSAPYKPYEMEYINKPLTKNNMTKQVGGFIRYPKIKRLGDSDTDGILDGPVYVQEKIDGANASIWTEDIDGVLNICLGSRSRCLCKFPLDVDKRPAELTGDGFRGFREYVAAHEGIAIYLQDNPEDRLYGEWLVPHSIQYSSEHYNKFYLFDITQGRTEIKCGSEDREGKEGVKVVPEGFISTTVVHIIARTYNITTPKLYVDFKEVTPEQIEEIAGKSELGKQGEGVVIKRDDFINKWGRHAHAKFVTDEFKESNATAFGGNNKSSTTYGEQKVCNKYMTLPRVKKVMQKILFTLGDDEELEMKHTSRVAGTSYNDMLTEEIWNIQKECNVISFKALARVCSKKAIHMFHDILKGHDSVAYEEKEEEITIK